ncbi:hypothetical protein [Bacillus sp. GG161]|uniref:hypothetical protein n=1 Tax=Bacillus sp. GG161 TaxID=2780507 RepID=UPI00209A8745|nr:hypothetical protein [Bacillus sp. GG161]
MNTTLIGILGIATMIIWIMVSTELSKSPKRKKKKTAAENSLYSCLRALYSPYLWFFHSFRISSCNLSIRLNRCGLF